LAVPIQVELPVGSPQVLSGRSVKVLAVPFSRVGVEPIAGGVAKGVKPARFIAVWLALNPSDAAVVPVAKLPRETVSARANDADVQRRAPRTTSLLKFFIGGLSSVDGQWAESHVEVVYNGR
jgi:hypothetical protein